jgi:hypothetical protein
MKIRRLLTNLPSFKRPLHLKTHHADIIRVLALFASFLFFRCAGAPTFSEVILFPYRGLKKPVIRPPDLPQYERNEFYLITDNQAGDSDGIPAWVSLYLEGGFRALEGTAEFQGKYVFVGTNSGNNLKALRQWASGFSAVRDFPRIAVGRIEARMTGRNLYPDDEYGQFFELLIKAASDAFYKEVVKEDDFWIRRRYPGADDEVRENYDYYVLVTIEKTAFEEQFKQIMESVTTTERLTRDQATAISRIISNFFEGF